MYAVLESDGKTINKTFKDYFEACDYAEHHVEDSPGAIRVIDGHVELYHVTKTELVPTILEEGLRPRIGWLSEILGEKEERIYFFPDEQEMHTALGNWMGEYIEEIEEEIGEEIPLSVLLIRLPLSLGIPITADVFYEKTINVSVDPRYITLLRDGE